MSTLSSQRTTSQCPICAEDMSISPSSRLLDLLLCILWPAHHGGHVRAIGLGCCGQVVCQTCLYRHVQSVLTEGITGQGRSRLLCPLGCGCDLDDTGIRKCLERAHPQSCLQKVIATLLMALLEWYGWFGLEREDPFQSSRYYECWWYLRHSQPLRQDLSRYEHWSVTVALRSIPANEDVVMQCPAPDCGYRWTTNASYRARKWQHERRPSFALWGYTPLKPQQDSTISLRWSQAEYVHINPLEASPPELDGYDGRRMVCAKCHCIFCGLCRQPWKGGRGLFGPRTHQGVRCNRYARMIRDRNDPEYAFVGQLSNTRCCPQCSMRTSRVDGCNHMTCPCGKEWCYVCESGWSPRHYVCADPPASSNNRDSYGCMVS